MIPVKTATPDFACNLLAKDGVLESCSVESENTPATKRHIKKQTPYGIPGGRAGRSGNHRPLTRRNPRLAAVQNFRVKVGLG
jgi:hypothetical protein